MKNTFIQIGFAVVSVCAASVCHADRIITSAGEQKGSFEQYNSNKFIFQTDQGSKVEHPRSAVRQLILDNPVKCTFTKTGSKKHESGELAGYDRLQFSFIQNGKKIDVSAMNIASIRTFQENKSEGDAGGSGDEFIPAVDVSGMEGAEMTASQQGTLENYKSVRKKYESFVIESSRMVKEMDASTGARREQLLNELRRRKNMEQPVRNEMAAAHRALLAAFPNPLPAAAPKPGARQPAQTAPAEGVRADKALASRDAAAEDQMLLIDTSALAGSAGLTSQQKDALVAYDGAVASYQLMSDKLADLATNANSAEEADKPAMMEKFEEGKKAMDAAVKEVIVSQKSLLKAFPQMHLTD